MCFMGNSTSTPQLRTLRKDELDWLKCHLKMSPYSLLRDEKKNLWSRMDIKTVGIRNLLIQV